VSAIVWEEHPAFDDRPTYGPRCPGYETHRWTLGVEDGEIFLHSGCQDCDFAIEFHEVAAHVTGRLSFEHAHLPGRCPNFMQFIGPCDCDYWFRFIPEGQT
jgi:hypothetical protein